MITAAPVEMDGADRGKHEHVIVSFTCMSHVWREIGESAGFDIFSRRAYFALMDGCDDNARRC